MRSGMAYKAITRPAHQGSELDEIRQPQLRKARVAATGAGQAEGAPVFPATASVEQSIATWRCS